MFKLVDTSKQLRFIPVLILLAILGFLLFTPTKLPVKNVIADEYVGIDSSVPVNNPTIVITDPFNGSIVEGVVLIKTEASSSAGILGVDFQIDGTHLASASAYPYYASWDTSGLAAGTWHSITATVYDLLNQSSSFSSVVQIAPTPTPTPTPTPLPVPAVTITNPLDGSTVKKRTTVVITAQASDQQGVAKVEFYVDNILTCTDFASAYTCNWEVPVRSKKSYTLAAKVYNIAGNTATQIISVTAR